jgi:post-segregation antitoxin (ccd killing protein)
MTEITVFLDNELEDKAKAAAAELGISLDVWITETIREKTADRWPPEVFALAGSWPDFPDIETLRAECRDNISRETL